MAGACLGQSLHIRAPTPLASPLEIIAEEAILHIAADDEVVVGVVRRRVAIPGQRAPVRCQPSVPSVGTREVLRAFSHTLYCTADRRTVRTGTRRASMLVLGSVPLEHHSSTPRGNPWGRIRPDVGSSVRRRSPCSHGSRPPEDSSPSRRAWRESPCRWCHRRPRIGPDRRDSAIPAECHVVVLFSDTKELLTLSRCQSSLQRR